MVQITNHDLTMWNMNHQQKGVGKQMEKVLFDFTKLKIRIYSVWANWTIDNHIITRPTDPDATAQEWVANKMEISSSRLKKILNNKAYFKIEEINKACEVLDISHEFIPIYFFTELNTAI